MQVHVINSGFNTDHGFFDVEVQSLKIDGNDRPYAIVSYPGWGRVDSCRAEFNGTEWVVDFD
jgi:hypothetical protein